MHSPRIDNDGAGLPRSRQRAFSLVEVTVALGLLSVAVVPLFGLLPVGVNLFKEAVDTTVQSQIVAKLTNLAEQTDFQNLNGVIAAKVTGAADAATPVYYYFDDQGTEISTTSAHAKDAIYTAAVMYVDQTDIPCGAQTAFSKNIATLWIDIYNNKGTFSGGAPVDPRKKRFVIHIANFGRRI